jgi:hypothetical protein
MLRAMNIRTKSDGTAISHPSPDPSPQGRGTDADPSPQGRGTDAEVIVDNENVQSVTDVTSVTNVTRKNNTTATITTENGRFDVETQCIAFLPGDMLKKIII